jgi:Ca-activated chloride channel family protein
MAWDRPAHTGYHAEEHVLRVRARLADASQDAHTLPLRMAVALDSSGSMEGDKLQQAKTACAAVVKLIRGQDRISLASFATGVVPLWEGTESHVASSKIDEVLTSLKAEGFTRTDLALDWIQLTLKPEPGVALVAVLITDGHATDDHGNFLEDSTPLIGKAVSMGQDGVTVFTIGLGNADDFNTAFLLDLTQPARGAFVHAHTPEALGQEMAKRTAACQEIVAEDARLTLRPMLDGAIIKKVCRIRPDFVPMDVSSSIRAGTLRAGKPTDFLVSVTIPPRRADRRLGPAPAVQVVLEAQGVNVSQETSIEYTASKVRAQQIDSSVHRDRFRWEYNTHTEALTRTSDPNKTRDLLTDVVVAAQGAGELQLAAHASQRLDELKASGELSSQHRTELLSQSRNLTEDS